MVTTTKLLITGIISLAISLYVHKGGEKRAHLETHEFDGRAKLNSKITAIGVCAFIFGVFCIIAFINRLIGW